MGKRKEKISSDIAWSTSDKISVRGLDLPNEILGHMNLGDLAFLQLTGRKATPEGDVWLMQPRGAGQGPPMEVLDPGLAEADIVAVNEQLGEILHGDLG